MYLWKATYFYMRDIVAIFIINIHTEISKTKILYCLFNVYISNTKKRSQICKNI